MSKGDDVYAEPVQVEDPPAPDLDDLQQREPAVLPPAVRVAVEGPIRAQRPPNRSGTPIADAVDTTTAVHLLGADLRRARATLIGTQDWFYMVDRSGIRAPIVKNVPIVIEHASDVWVLMQSQAGTMVAIPEYFAD